jgi:hypothetical protein
MVAGDRSYGIGDRWPDTLETHQRLIGAVRAMARQARLRSTPLDAAHLHANATASRRGKPLAAFASGHAANTQKRPRRGRRRAEAACVGTPAGWAWGTGLRQPRVLALGYEVGLL